MVLTKLNILCKDLSEQLFTMSSYLQAKMLKILVLLQTNIGGEHANPKVSNEHNKFILYIVLFISC